MSSRMVAAPPSLLTAAWPFCMAARSALAPRMPVPHVCSDPATHATTCPSNPQVVQKVEYPFWIVYLASGFTFGGGLLGITYGVLSTSWDARREGSWLGWTVRGGVLAWHVVGSLLGSLGRDQAGVDCDGGDNLTSCGMVDARRSFRPMYQC